MTDNLLLTDKEITTIWHNQAKELDTETVAQAAKRVAKAQHAMILAELKRLSTEYSYLDEFGSKVADLIDRMEQAK